MFTHFIKSRPFLIFSDSVPLKDRCELCVYDIKQAS